MRTCLITWIVFIFAAFDSFSQSLSVFDVDTSGYPEIKAKFIITGVSPDSLKYIQPWDFTVSENNLLQTVKSIDCDGSYQQTDPLSIVCSFDVSVSMLSSSQGGDASRMDLAKWLGSAIVGSYSYSKTEIAVQACNSTPRLVQDFTTDRATLSNKILQLEPMGFNQLYTQLLDRDYGLLPLAAKGKYKRVAVLFTDAESFNFDNNMYNMCRQMCSKYNISFYAFLFDRVTPANKGAITNFKKLADSTGGRSYAGIIYKKDVELMKNQMPEIIEPDSVCTIAWNSPPQCSGRLRETIVVYKPRALSCNFNYISSYKSELSLEVIKPVTFFDFTEKGVTQSAFVEIKATRGDFSVSGIKSESPFFTVDPPAFSLRNGEMKYLTINYTPLYYNYILNKFTITTDKCNKDFYACFLGSSDTNNLVVTFPAGGETLFAATDTLLGWEGNAPGSVVDLFYSTNSGMKWKLLAAGAGGLNYLWADIPSTPSDSCLLKVRTGSGMIAGEPFRPIRNFSDTGNYYNSVAWSPDEKYIAIAKTGRDIDVIDAATGIKARVLKGHKSPVRDVSWSPSGDMIASCSQDNTIIIWDVKTSSAYKIISLNGYYCSNIAWSPDGSKIAGAASNQRLYVWDWAKWDVVHMISTQPDFPFPLAWSHDGTLLAFGGRLGKLYILDISMGIINYSMPVNDTTPVYSLSWNGDGSKLALSCSDGIRIFNINEDAFTGLIRTDSCLEKSIDWNSRRDIISCACHDSSRNGELRFYDAGKGVLLGNPAAMKGLFAVDWGAKGKSLLAAGQEGSVSVWETESSIMKEGISDSLWSIKTIDQPKKSKVVLAVPDAEASPGDIVEITIEMKYALNLPEIVPVGITAGMKFNASVLAPVDEPYGTVTADNERIVPVNMAVKSGDDKVLVRKKFRAGLGNDSLTRISLVDLSYDPGNISVDTLSGTFTLKGLCREGGARLVNPNSPVQGIINISPSPAGSFVEVEYMQNSSDNVSISLIDCLGRNIMTMSSIKSNSKQTSVFATDGLAPGVYFIVLSCPGYSDARRLIISR